MIISKSNPKIKEVRSLKQKKFRDELGLYFVEGHKMVKEAVSFNLPIKYIIGVKVLHLVKHDSLEITA